MWLSGSEREVYSRGEHLMHFSTLDCKTRVHAERLQRQQVCHTGAFGCALLNRNAGSLLVSQPRFAGVTDADSPG